MDSALKSHNLHTNEDWALRRQLSPHLQTLNKWAKDLLFTVSCEFSVEDAEHFYSIGSEFMRHEYFDDAFEWLSRALNSQEEKYGTSHTTTLKTVSKLGSLYESQGKINLALAYFERAFTGQRRIYGEEHDLTLRSLDGIGRVYSQMKEDQKSSEILEQVWSVRKRVLGELHQDTLDSYYVLGAHLGALQQTAKALDMSMLALVGREEALGKDNPSTLEAACLVGRVHLVMENYEESMKYYQRALLGQENHFGPDHAQALKCAFGIGMVHQYRSEFDAALECYARVLVGREVLYGKDHHTVLEVVQKIAEVQFGTAQYHAAVNSYSRLLTSRTAAPGKDHTDSFKIVDKIAGVYVEADRHEDALGWYKRLSAVLKQLKGPADAETLDTRLHVAHCFYNLKYFSGATDIYDSVLEAYNSIPNVNQSLVQDVHLYLGEAYFCDGNNLKALAYLEPAFNFFMESLLENYSKANQTLTCLGLSAARAEKWSVAASHCITMMEILASPKADGIDPKGALWTIFIVVIHGVGKQLLLLGHDNIATKCFNIILKYWKMSENGKEDQPAACDGCAIHGGEQSNINGTRYVCRTCANTDLCEECWQKYDGGAFGLLDCKAHRYFASLPLLVSAQTFENAVEEQVSFFTEELKGLHEEMLALESGGSKEDLRA